MTHLSTIPNHLTHLKYRADIDGLRAIAVLSVVGFHVSPNKIQAGFIGVDIFFVISGFLISSIIFSNLENNTFSLTEFYVRRIRRIFPALIVILISSLCIGWFVLLNNEFQQLGKHTAAGALFISNFVLWHESGYFDNAATHKPLLHLWSLAIEDQFYLFWPLMLAFVWRRKWNFMAITLIIAVMSFAFNIHIIYSEPTAAFYSPASRFWELMVGGLLAYISLHKPYLNAHYKNAQSCLGFFLLALSFLVIDKDRSFPNWWAVFPTGSAFFIISASPNAWLNKHILANKILVGVGLISYPLYLWHWPLLSFANIIGNSIPLSTHDMQATKICVVLASLVLAWLTYQLVEKPIRFSKNSESKAAVFLVLMACVLTVGLLINQGVLHPKNDVPALRSIISAFDDREYPGQLKKYKPIAHGVYYQEGDSSDITVFIGDSHIEQYGARIVDVIKSKRATTNTAIFVTTRGCVPIPGVLEDFSIGQSCKETLENGLTLANDAKVKTVVIGACWNCYFLTESVYPKTQADDLDYYFFSKGKKELLRNDLGRQLALKNLEDLIKKISTTKKVYLLLDNPGGEEFSPHTFLNGNRLSDIAIKTESRTSPIDIAQLKLRDELIAIATRAGIETIDPLPKLCNGKQCDRLSLDGKPVYSDTNHLRPFYVQEQADYVDKTLMKLGNSR